MKKKIIGIGELLWDILPDGKVLGGAPANFAYHASQLGCEGYAVSAVGNDPLGNEILEGLNKRKLGHLVEVTEYPTGTVQVTLDEAGVPQYQICENVAWDNIPLTPEMEKLARSADAVCFGSLAQRNSTSRETTRRFLSLVPDSAFKIFDINLRQHFYTKELIEASLKICNILKINDDEVRIISALFDYAEHSETEICQRLLHEYDLNMVILTKGAQGSYVVSADEISFCETPKVRIADTVGAGDSFSGAFISALLQGQPVKKAHQLGVEVSAYVCTQHGAMPLLPDSFCNLLK